MPSRSLPLLLSPVLFIYEYMVLDISSSFIGLLIPKVSLNPLPTVNVSFSFGILMGLPTGVAIVISYS